MQAGNLICILTLLSRYFYYNFQQTEKLEVLRLKVFLSSTDLVKIDGHGIKFELLYLLNLKFLILPYYVLTPHQFLSESLFHHFFFIVNT